MKLLIERAIVVSSREVIHDGFILVENGLIKRVGKDSEKPVDVTARLNADGLLVAPGFVDTHTHGIHGLDVTNNNSPSSILEMGKYYVKHGVTSFLPSTVTAPYSILQDACKSVKEAIGTWRPEYGARPLGIHLEGPWINPDFAGAQNKEHIKAPSTRDFKALYEVAGGVIKQVTIAPELPGAMDLIRLASSLGIVVSAGHTDADYDIGLESVKAGVKKATHLFNAMARFNHRKPGITLALLQSPGVYLELIVDFVHLHPAVVRLVVEYAGSDRVVVVSDSIAAADMPDGRYSLGGLEVEVVGGVCKLFGKDVLAGSTLTMDVALRNMFSLNYSLSDVVKMVSLTPARSIGVNSLGDIAPGFYADLVMLNEKLHVEKTFINGELVYEK